MVLRAGSKCRKWICREETLSFSDRRSIVDLEITTRSILSRCSLCSTLTISLAHLRPSLSRATLSVARSPRPLALSHDSLRCARATALVRRSLSLSRTTLFVARYLSLILRPLALSRAALTWDTRASLHYCHTVNTCVTIWWQVEITSDWLYWSDSRYRLYPSETVYPRALSRVPIPIRAKTDLSRFRGTCAVWLSVRSCAESRRRD